MALYTAKAAVTETEDSRAVSPPWEATSDKVWADLAGFSSTQWQILLCEPHLLSNEVSFVCSQTLMEV